MHVAKTQLFGARLVARRRNCIVLCVVLVSSRSRQGVTTVGTFVVLLILPGTLALLKAAHGPVFIVERVSRRRLHSSCGVAFVGRGLAVSASCAVRSMRKLK